MGSRANLFGETLMDYPGNSRPCPCGKRAVLYYAGTILTTHPPQSCTEWRCYGCGRFNSGPFVRVIASLQDQSVKAWEEANR